LEQRLGVRFRDVTLLNQALLHRSYLNGRSATRTDSNERMEFLGDSVLGLVVNEHLYRKYPEENEGNLTKIKSLIVSRQILAQKAEETGLGRYLLLSSSESEAGGRTRASIIADALEAVIGAIYLDQGLPAAQGFVQGIILDEVRELTQNEDNLNYKSLLQEKVQGERKLHPVYRIRKEMGPDHEKTFHVDVSVGGQVVGHGEGHTKKEAEQAAARSALERAGVRGERPHRGRRHRRPRRP
jgi:ribonuclease-3